MHHIYFEEGENYNIKGEKIVKVYEYKGEKSMKVKDCTKPIINSLKNIKRINKNEYMNIETGEVFQYKKREKRNKKSMNRSMNKLDEYLSNNFSGDKNEIFLTMTYEKGEADYDKAVEDLNEFWKKLKREFQDLEYVGIIESQALRKSWHIHMLIKDIGHKELYIPKEELNRIWGKGHIFVSRIVNREMRQILNDLTVGDNNGNAIKKVIKYMCKVNSKEDIPMYKKMYHKSNGIKGPVIKEMKYSDVQKELECWNLLSEKTLLIKSDNTDRIIRKIKEEVYEKK